MRHSEKFTLERDVDVMRDYVLKNKEIKISKFDFSKFARENKPVLYILSDSDGDSPIKKFPDQYILSNRLSRKQSNSDVFSTLKFSYYDLNKERSLFTT